ncbi:hypothetical protein KFK14_03375 [Sphingobium phenoxybenzoativorans]|uniref:Uncharacterized protein n=1 Tax=Sphingobium phenoxybenzoativorans TaxID=1592790 RepID=A0A975K826_9SPHN|nr:hypothetical protein [Sphingobium phenoxybenzoativorans]QUT06518.1 hypothetical protein KFK14_03375 [Sphingobium phenoxybenzoativorans]
MKGLLKLGAIGLFSAYLFRLLNKVSEMAEEPKPYPSIRDAGPEYQEGIDPKDWDLVDEQSDESFPASDPPGNY